MADIKKEENTANSIFRKKSVERVSSPEQLDTYLKVTSPKVWIILCGIIVLLIGFIFWAATGKVEISDPTTCYIEEHEIHCYIKEDTFNKLTQEKQYIRLDDYPDAFKVKDLLYLGPINETTGDVYELVADGDVENTVMIKGKVIIETISPIHFIFN